MTKKIMITLGVLTMFLGLFAPYQGNDLWSFFISVSPQAAILREIIGFSLVAYALTPELRSLNIAKLFGSFGAALIVLTMLAVFTNHVPLLDAFNYLLAGNFALLGSLELPLTPQTGVLSFRVPHLRVPHFSGMRHAH